MNKIPARTVINFKSIRNLDQALNEKFGSTQLFSFLGEFKGFLESSDLALSEAEQSSKEEIDKSIILRDLVWRKFSGGNSFQTLNSEMELDEVSFFSKDSYLMNLKVGESLRIPETTNREWLHLKSLPESWVKFSNNKNNTIFVGGKSSSFRSWDDFGLKSFPIDSAVIIDPYLFQEKDDMVVNIPRIINGLVNSGKEKQLLNVLFIVAGNIHKRFTTEEFIKKSIENLKTILKDNFEEHTIKVSTAFLKGEYMHDRYIFTNYYFLDAGKGFNFFNKYGSLNPKNSNKVSLKFLSGPNANQEFEEALANNCSEIFNKNVVLKTEGNWNSNSIINHLMRVKNYKS